ncbi:MAG: AAA-like domain-containing protein [Hassallia sp.]
MATVPRSGYEYQVGGSLPINAPTYVRRQADEDFYQSLKKGEFCYVLNSRQMGKSSLRVQTMQSLQDEEFACAAIDITAIGSADITPVEWYAGVIDSLVGSFNLYTGFDLNSWWHENGLLSPVQHLSKFIETVLLEQVTQNIVIFIDEIDSILSLQFNLDDFFAVIRDCYNRRASQPAYNRLTFALLGVSTPSDLIQDRQRTPFNIGRAIDLTGFKLHEAEALAQGLALLGNPQELMQAVIDWTGGQPFLTQRVCRLLLKYGENGELGEFSPNSPSSTPPLLVENLVRRHIIQHWEAQDEPEHLKTIRDRMLRGYEKRTGRLLGLCQQILTSPLAPQLRSRSVPKAGEGDNSPPSLLGKRAGGLGQNPGLVGIPADDSPEQTQLRLTGLVVRRDGKLKIYNRIYESVFNLAWVEQELAKLRPYTDAFDAWMASNFEDESRLLRGQALQDALVWANDKGLSDEDNRFLRASQEFANREVEKALAVREEEGRILAKANEKLNTAKEKAKRQIRFGSGFLVISIVGAIVASVLAANAHNALQAALTATRLEQTGINLLRQPSQRADIEGLLTAIRAGRELKSLVRDKQSLADYPAYSPLVSLQTILLNIHQKNSLEGHKDVVRSVVYSPDGKTLASASDDSSIKLWNIATGKKIATLTGHKDGVNSATYSPDGKTLVSTSVDKTIKLWNVATGKEISTLTGHKDVVNSVAYSPDGKTLASAGVGNSIKLWNIDTGKEISTLTGHRYTPKDLVFSPDGKTLASASDDSSIKLWNVGTKKEIFTLTGHGKSVHRVVYSPDGKTLASASDDSSIKLWNVATGKEISTLNGHKDSVMSVAYSPDGKTLASASADGTIKLWSLDLDDLLKHGCKYLEDYFASHPDAKKGLCP